MSNSSQDHINFADTLTSQAIDILKILERKNEEVKKKACLRWFCTSMPLPHQVFSTGNAILPKVTLGTGPVIHRAPQGQEKLNVSADLSWKSGVYSEQTKGLDNNDYSKAHLEVDLSVFPAVWWRLRGGWVIPAETGRILPHFLVHFGDLNWMSLGTSRRRQTRWSGGKASGAAAKWYVELQEVASNVFFLSGWTADTLLQ